MIKLYRAFNNNGHIKVEDRIVFNDSRFNSEDQIRTIKPNIKVANYENMSLDRFNKFTDEVIQGKDDFLLLNPTDYQSLEEYVKSYGIRRDSKDYDYYRLNEEAVLLVTNGVWLVVDDEESVERIVGTWGRLKLNGKPYFESGMYLVKPNATFSMAVEPKIQRDYSFVLRNLESYELLQSNNIGKRLVLTRMNRRIPDEF